MPLVVLGYSVGVVGQSHATYNRQTTKNIFSTLKQLEFYTVVTLQVYICFVSLQKKLIFRGICFCNCAQSQKGVSIRKTIVGVQQLSEKIKLKEETISEILDADTDSESGAEATDVEDDFQQQSAAAAKVEPQAATSGRLPTWEPPQGTNRNIHPFVSTAKGVKKVRLHTSTQTAHHCLC